MYDTLTYEEDDNYPRLVFREQVLDDSGQIEINCHEIPMQAVADRMELYGLESVEQTLEYIGLEASDPETADTLHGGIQEAYGQVVQSEFAQTLMPSPAVQE